MSKFAAFTKLQKQLGQEAAEAVVEFVGAYHEEVVRNRRATQKTLVANGENFRADSNELTLDRTKTPERLPHPGASIIETFSNQCN